MFLVLCISEFPVFFFCGSSKLRVCFYYEDGISYSKEETVPLMKDLRY